VAQQSHIEFSQALVAKALRHESAETHSSSQQSLASVDPLSRKVVRVTLSRLMGDIRNSGARSDRPGHALTGERLDVSSRITDEENTSTGRRRCVS
jgi:hypothetical protein